MMTIHADTEDDNVKVTVSNGSIAFVFAMDIQATQIASEGLRIALPWGKKTEAALDAWDLYQEILGNLKAVPSKFDQKSVGNNLNDLMKVQPEKAWHIIHKWEAEGPAKETQWIIKHGKRSLK